ncbi:MAG: protein kinase [Verrucomicrobia bacterium]|nr:protein kinase [Verrucomicrobiota bacterium]
MSAKEVRTCQTCGATLAPQDEFCPVCAFRGALQSDEAATEPSEPPASRFGHYEILRHDDGSLFELGRGAMGITYKAFDVDLRRFAALKVISPRYLADQAARFRFLREARAAGSVRHPNVASVFQLGTSQEHYFYAMEFVEGETLGRLIKRSSNLDARLALEIVAQVAAGLEAIHKQNLVHRDIKPSNIMVSSAADGAVSVSIIDLGLAKTLTESESQEISILGAFAGTPEFASPEQFTGADVDIRSDLYSLGITLWQMLTGEPPFRGSPSAVMHQHLNSPLPLEKLRAISQPVVALVEVLLRKDPARRFQTPAELAKALPTVIGAIETGQLVRQTIRAFVSSSSDVQTERNLANRIVRAIAAEFDLPVSESGSDFQRLTAVDPLSENNATEKDEDQEHQKFALCFQFWNYSGKGEVRRLPDPGNFELVICLLGNEMGLPVHPDLRLPDGGVPASGTEYVIAWAAEHASRNHGLPVLRVYHNKPNLAVSLGLSPEREDSAKEWNPENNFLAEWEEKRKGTTEFNRHKILEEFEEQFRNHFRDFVAEQIKQDARSTLPERRVRRWKSSPFRGLKVFDFEHAPIFFGRAKAIGEVLEALDQQRKVWRPFVLIVGGSGSGKSSLVRAGVLPQLTQPGTIEGVGLWRRAVTRPGGGGSGGDCFDALANALLDSAALPALENPESTNAIQDLAAELRDNPEAVALRVRDALDNAAREWKMQKAVYLREKEEKSRSSGSTTVPGLIGPRRPAEAPELPKARLALVVDQLEELFTSGFSTDIQQKYVSAISGLAQSHRVFVLATLRSDFYSSYQAFPELTELTRPSGKVDLRPPTAYEVGNMIRLPAEAAGLQFELDRKSGQRLDEGLRDAAATTPESLPLLQHVLSLLYDKQAERSDGLLRWSDYRDLGELKGALAKYAEAVFATLQPHEQHAFPLVMRHLVTLGQGEEEAPNRRTTPYRDFVVDDSEDGKSGAKAFVDLFIAKRLFIADTDPHGEVNVGVAHEALLREWQRVREWLAENRDFLRMRDRLDSSLKLWLSRGKQKDDLLGPGLPLAEGEKLLKDFEPSLSQTQTNYVRASITEEKRKHRIRDRIRYVVMAGITAALIVAVIFGVVSYRQFRRAERAKIAADQAAKRATLARSDAEKLINYMTTDLRDKLKPIGRLDLLDDVNQRVLGYYAALGNDSNNSDILSQRSVALANAGDIQKDRGNLAAALKNYSDSLDIRERLAHQNPLNSDSQRYWALGIANVGDVLDLQGKSSAALERYHMALKILQELVARQSGNVGLRHDLSAMHENIGHVLENRGDLTRALQSYQDCLSIRRELKKQEPDNNERDHDISLILLRVGQVFSRQGSLADTINSYRESLAIQQKLADAEPTNAMWQQELSTSKERVAYALTEQGDLGGALNMLRESLAIVVKLTERDSSNAIWQGMLARRYGDLTDVYESQGNLADALRDCQRALEIREMLAKRDPSNANAQRVLATGYDDIGKVLELQGDEAGAKGKYNISLSISRKLVAQDPENAEWQRDLSISLERLGNVLSAEGDLAGALDKDLESLAIRKKLANRDESNAQWQNDLSWSYISVGDLFGAKKDLEDALTNYRTAQTLERELVHRDPKTLELQSDLAVTCQKIGEVLSAQGRIPEALANYRQSVMIVEDLVDRDPTNGEWASELALACYSAAISLSDIAKQPTEESRTLLRRGRDILIKLQSESALSPVDEHRLQQIQAALGGS